MAREQTAAEKLEGSIGHAKDEPKKGKWSFQIECVKCGKSEHLPARMQVVRHPRFIRKAAMDYASKGWTFNEGPICPECGA